MAEGGGVREKDRVVEESFPEGLKNRVLCVHEEGVVAAIEYIPDYARHG